MVLESADKMGDVEVAVCDGNWWNGKCGSRDMWR